MTTIRDALVDVIGRDLAAFDPADICDHLGIDPDTPVGSGRWVPYPICPTCEDGWVYLTGYARKRCPTCGGTGHVPAEWATSDACLRYLDEHEVPYPDSPWHADLIAACQAVQEATDG